MLGPNPQIAGLGPADFLTPDGVRVKTDWLRIRIMCLSEATCLLMDCCFSELAL